LNSSCFLPGPVSKTAESFFRNIFLGEAGALVFLVIDRFMSE
jgi:hypothetical protein